MLRIIFFSRLFFGNCEILPVRSEEILLVLAEPNRDVPLVKNCQRAVENSILNLFFFLRG